MGNRIDWTLDEIKSRCEVEGKCWIWQRALNGEGVPLMTFKGKPIQVRRFVFFELMKKVKRNGYVVTARCLEKRCCSPECLVSLTRKELSTRVHAKVKASANEGATYARHLRTIIKQGNVTLNLELARKMRREAGGRTLAEIAAEYGVTPKTCSQILRHKSWRESAQGASVFNWRP